MPVSNSLCRIFEFLNTDYDHDDHDIDDFDNDDHENNDHDLDDHDNDDNGESATLQAPIRWWELLQW